MKRTNIVLGDTQYEFLKERSQQSGKSMSAILRDLIDGLIVRRSSARDPIRSIVGLGRSKGSRAPGPRHDEILYQRERRRGR
jgi:hypothetical protein